MRVRAASYPSGELEVPVEIFSPGNFPVVVFLHGRRGLDELTRLVPLRLAARAIDFALALPEARG